MSVAKNLVAGHILEDQLFPYPRLRDKVQDVDSGSEDYSVEAAISKVFALRLCAALSALKIFTLMPQLLRGPAGISAWPITFAEPSAMRIRR
jgi:hypothetical protein